MSLKASRLKKIYVFYGLIKIAGKTSGSVLNYKGLFFYIGKKNYNTKSF